MTSRSTIPNWDASGLLPPIKPGEEGHSALRSPYRTSLIEVINRFCTSIARASILEGYLNFRKDLHSAGLNSGFQWLDGSFVEKKEARLGEAPEDIDVVTFANLPPGKTQSVLKSAQPNLFDHLLVKSTYKVDGYFQFLGTETNAYFVRQVNYWASMWAHTRNREWKGFLQVDLASTQDADSLTYLQELREQL